MRPNETETRVSGTYWVTKADKIEAISFSFYNLFISYNIKITLLLLSGNAHKVRLAQDGINT